MTIAPNGNYTLAKQEFLNSVINKIGKQEFSNKLYENPLKRIRGEFIEGPSDIEEIYVERVADTGFDKEGTGVLDRVKPNVTVQYHTNTIEHGYKCTVQMKEMRKGFTSKNSLQTMAQGIINSLHTGSEVDDYNDCINTLTALTQAPKGTKENVITVSPVIDEITSKEFTKAVKKVVHKMKDYSGTYSDKPNYANASDLVLFIDSDVEVETSVELLATAFNKSIAELNETTKIVIPNMKEKVGAIAVVCHEKCLKINPLYYDIDSIKNTRGKFVNYDLATETLLSYTTWYPHAIFKDSETMKLSKARKQEIEKTFPTEE